MKYITARILYDTCKHQLPFTVRSYRDVEVLLERLCSAGLMTRCGLLHGEPCYRNTVLGQFEYEMLYGDYHAKGKGRATPTI